MCIYVQNYTQADLNITGVCESVMLAEFWPDSAESQPIMVDTHTFGCSSTCIICNQVLIINDFKNISFIDNLLHKFDFFELLTLLRTYRRKMRSKVP